MDSDRRKRPWRTLRVVVEVSVPPSSKATEKDLKFHVEEAMPHAIPLRRACHSNAQDAVVRVKSFTPFWPMFLRKERGQRVGRKPSRDTSLDI